MNAETVQEDFKKSRQHFEMLDGLRGIAALAVVIFHFMEWVYPDVNENFIGHGFLAVDFFFCLSGFVIGYAYDNRIRKIGVAAFFRLRLIRLHPLVVFGAVLGVTGFLLDPFVPPITQNTGTVILLFIGSILLIPLPVMEERAFNLFAFNAPAWSLFWEYVANIFYAWILCKLSRRTLLLLTVLAALVLSWVAYRAGNLLGGWSKDNFWDGGARVAYSFLAGLLLYRSNWVIRNRIGFAVMAVLLFLVFIMPGTRWNWLTETVVVLFYFPLIVALGAGAKPLSGAKQLCRFSGNISYPLYMTHYAAIWVFGNYYSSAKPTASSLACIMVAGVILLVGIAYLVQRFYDTPVRKWLSQKNARDV